MKNIFYVLERAFEIGRSIAERITRENPAPVKLKFEV